MNERKFVNGSLERIILLCFESSFGDYDEETKEAENDIAALVYYDEN